MLAGKLGKDEEAGVKWVTNLIIRKISGHCCDGDEEAGARDIANLILKALSGNCRDGNTVTQRSRGALQES
jgi:hypothetical protein